MLKLLAESSNQYL